jgi:hypothetical protein
MANAKEGERDEPLRKPVVWLHGEVKTPPFTPEGRQEAGMLLRLLRTRTNGRHETKSTGSSGLEDRRRS